MKWRGNRESSNVEDRRGRSTGRRVAAGGGIGVIIIIVLSLLTGKDLSSLINMTGGMEQVPTQQHGTPPQRQDEMDKFVKVILASTEDVWTPIFQQQLKMNYRKPGLVLFSGATRSACGGADQAMGPFYCPADEKVYIDLSFADQLRTKLRAPGEAAMAYVVAHEVGHHIQTLIGLSSKVQAQRQRLSKTAYNKLSVKLELQADFLAGVWLHYSQKEKNWIDMKDLESIMRAAHAIGDDNLQKQAQGYVVPESFTHGTSQQRMYWFKKGFETGDLREGNFNQIR